jgi:positive regulator of sigma E activity
MDLLKSILLGYLRHGLTIAAGYLLAQGLIRQADEQVLISAVLALAGVAWSTASKLVANYELQKATKSMPPGVIPPVPVGPVTKA